MEIINKFKELSKKNKIIILAIIIIIFIRFTSRVLFCIQKGRPHRPALPCSQQNVRGRYLPYICRHISIHSISDSPDSNTPAPAPQTVRPFSPAHHQNKSLRRRTRVSGSAPGPSGWRNGCRSRHPHSSCPA